MDGIPADVEVPFDLSWDVTLTAKPVGNFVEPLRQPPPGQGPAPQGAPPAAPNGVLLTRREHLPRPVTSPR